VTAPARTGDIDVWLLDYSGLAVEHRSMLASLTVGSYTTDALHQRGAPIAPCGHHGGAVSGCQLRVMRSARCS
jgi:hypothetical protein